VSTRIPGYLAELTPEEAYLWESARAWRASQQPYPAILALDWSRLIPIARSNRMSPLLYRSLRASDQFEVLPAAIRQEIQEDSDRLDRDASVMSAALKSFLHKAAERGIEVVVHKGLWLSVNIYRDPGMRPGGDIDILVRKQDVETCLNLLEEIGVGRHWPNLLDDRYYARHHLHQQRCTPDLKVWFEVHWALDHPYTLLTIDYEAMMDKASPGALLGEPVCELSPPDRLLSLAVHLVKHAIYLPSQVGRPVNTSRLARLILADGMLMYYLDIAEVIGHYQAEIDWESLVSLARRSGTVGILGAVFHACRELLGAPIPERVTEALVIEGSGEIVRRAMDQVANQQLANYSGESSNRLWRFLVMTNGAFILRPIRALDLGAYLFPGPDYLQRRYGKNTFLSAAGHTLKASGQYIRMAFDTLYFTWERYRRLKALNRSASLFNRLEVDEPG
jgi:Uncharacterised nucleotidyltransferase